METRTGERSAFQDIICKTWALSDGLTTWLATSLNKVGEIQARKQGEAKTCQVFIYMSDALTRARNQNYLQFLPTSFITPPCLCPCHCTVEHAACFLLDGWTETVKAWEHQEPVIFFSLFTTGYQRMGVGFPVVEWINREETLQRVHQKITPMKC